MHVWMSSSLFEFPLYPTPSSRMANGMSRILLCTFMLMFARRGMTSSRFLSDFAVSIVETHLNSTFVKTPPGWEPPTFKKSIPYHSPLYSTTPRTTTAPTKPYSNNLHAIPFWQAPIPHQDLIFSTNPVVERGTAGSYDKQHGEIEINVDGTYVFIVHRVGVSVMANPFLPVLLKVNNATNHDVTLAKILDNGEGSIFNANVLAELKSGDSVYIQTQGSDVIGNENQPFIFTVFLLYHNPYLSFPRARQSAFSVTGVANLSFAETVIDDFEAPTVNIGDGFDSLTGVFTVPFGGLYVFHVSITSAPKGDGSGRSAVAVLVNGETIAQVTHRVPDIKMVFRCNYYLVPARNTAISVTQILNQGDEVFLQNVIANEGIDGNVMFVGYLLS